MTTDDERIAYCALNMLFGFKPGEAAALIGQAGGSAMNVFRMNHMIPELNGRALSDAEAELERVRKGGAHFICLADSEYPPMLKECADPPLGLYVRCSGDPSKALGSRPAVAVVGTRGMTAYGRDWCKEFIRAIARTGESATIISGLAYGVDITAHSAALDCGLPTIGVMATGIDKIYPSAHRPIAESMTEEEGCALMTDYPLGTTPLPAYFLRRNRIIAALADKLVLVESKARGGGMMTARLAYSYEREVYALPGKVWDEKSEGCNLLISNKMAEILPNPEEAVRTMGLGNPKKKPDIMGIVRDLYDGMDAESLQGALAIVEAVRKKRGIGIQELSAATGLGLGQVTALAEMLSADGILEVDLMGGCSMK